MNINMPLFLIHVLVIPGYTQQAKKVLQGFKNGVAEQA